MAWLAMAGRNRGAFQRYADEQLEFGAIVMREPRVQVDDQIKADRLTALLKLFATFAHGLVPVAARFCSRLPRPYGYNRPVICRTGLAGPYQGRR